MRNMHSLFPILRFLKHFRRPAIKPHLSSLLKPEETDLMNSSQRAEEDHLIGSYLSSIMMHIDRGSSLGEKNGHNH